MSLAVFLICNLAIGQLSLVSMTNVASAAGASSVDVLDSEFINSHGGNSVSVHADPSRSPYEVLAKLLERITLLKVPPKRQEIFSEKRPKDMWRITMIRH